MRVTPFGAVVGFYAADATRRLGSVLTAFSVVGLEHGKVTMRRSGGATISHAIWMAVRSVDHS